MPQKLQSLKGEKSKITWKSTHLNQWKQTNKKRHIACKDNIAQFGFSFVLSDS